MYILDEKSKTPLHLQLYNALKDDISSNYQAGDKLPSIRKVATLYNLSKTTVETNANELSFFELNSSGVNTPIPKIQTAYTEPMASA